MSNNRITENSYWKHNIRTSKNIHAHKHNYGKFLQKTQYENIKKQFMPYNRITENSYRTHNNIRT